MSILMLLTTNRPALRARGARGITLVELLTVFAIILALVAMAMPALQGIEATKMRTQCQANTRIFVGACHQFALDNANLEYPIGSVGVAAEVEGEDDVPDDYTQISPSAFTALTTYGVTPESTTCKTIGEQDWLFSTDIDAPYRMGMIYWLGREDILDADDNVIYQSRQRYDKQYDPTSRTVVTCLAFDSHTPGTGEMSVMPHLGNACKVYGAAEPNPWTGSQHHDGLAVGYIDGSSAAFVKYEDLTDITQYHRIWYVAH